MDNINLIDWLCQIEHELIMCGIGSIDASRLVKENEAMLKTKYESQATAVSAATGLRINK